MSLREYQQEAVDAILKFLRTTEGNPLIVAPTGSGKSHIIAELIRQRYKEIEQYRCIVLSHRKEILQQNTAKLLSCWPEAPLGVYSAGLRSRRIHKITIAGVQSIYSKAELFGIVHDVIVDECHLIPKKGQGMYLRFLKEIRKKNPNVKVIGATATPYRLDSGLLTAGKDRIFTDIAHDIEILPLVERGFLSRLVSKNSTTQADLSGVRVVAGDYVTKEAAQRMDAQELVRKAVAEIVTLGAERKSWLVFCTSVEHVAHVVEGFKRHGIAAAGVTGETPSFERDRILGEIKSGKLRCVCNCEVLTIGFDAPNLDLIALLRPTKSTSLYVQMIGRGMRVFPEKPNCLVLDYAGNLEEHGPINRIKVSKEKEEVEREPIRTCPECREACPIRAKECPECGFVFPEPEEAPRKINHATEASTAPVLGSFQPPQTFQVQSREFRKHWNRKHPNKPPTLRIVYRVGMFKDFSEWLCFEHQGFAQQKACRAWLAAGGRMPCPISIDEALERQRELKNVEAITVSFTKDFPEIIRKRFSTEKEEQERQEARAELEAYGIL